MKKWGGGEEGGEEGKGEGEKERETNQVNQKPLDYLVNLQKKKGCMFDTLFVWWHFIFILKN